MVNNECALHFPKLIQNCLPRLGLDHVLIQLEVGIHRSSLRPFRFELAWSTVEGFQELVIQWWSSLSPVDCGAFVLAKKLISLHSHLRIGAKFNFGSIKLKKLACLQEVEALDIAKESHRLTLSELQQEQELFENLKEIHRQDEVYWRQRLRVQWLKEGDENMKSFHTVANGRKNQNFIPNIQ